jgi:general secretion pathway protein D
LVVAPVSSALAQRPSDETRISHLFLKDADLMTAVQMVMQRTGVQIVFDSSQEPYNKVFLNIDDMTVENAIGYICKAAGAFVRRDENGVYIISHNPAKGEVLPANPPVKVIKMVKKIKLSHADPKAVYDMLMFQIPFSSSQGFDALRKFTADANTNNELNKFWGGNLSVQTTPSQTFTPVNSRQSMPIQGTESGNDIRLPGEFGSQGLQGGGGAQGGGGGAQGGAGGQGRGGATLTGGQGLVPQGIDFISYDPTDNSIVVRGTEEDIAELQRNITLFDTPPRQVQIKVEFVTTTENLDKSIGYDFLYQRGPLFTGNRPGTFARSSDPVFLNYATGNITSRLRTLLQEGRGKVVSAPIVRTLNNQPATIASSIQTTIFINQSVVSNGVIVTTSNPVPLQAQTFLTVAPRINDDGFITVAISPQVANFVGTSRAPDGTEIPNLVTQFINVVARVKNGETIVLGGLANKNDNSTTSRIPLLSDLPIIGQFFRGSDHTKVNSDLLIFITPTIIEDEENGGGG